MVGTLASIMLCNWLRVYIGWTGSLIAEETQVGPFVRIDWSHLKISSVWCLLQIVAVWQSLLRIWIRFYQKVLRGLTHLQSHGVHSKCAPWNRTSTVTWTSWTLGRPTRLMPAQFFRWTFRFLVTSAKSIPLRDNLLLVMSAGWH